MKNYKYKPFFRSLAVMAILMGASAADSKAQDLTDGSDSPAVDEGEGKKTELVNLLFSQKSSEDILGGVSYVDPKEVFDKSYHRGAFDNLYSLVSGYDGGSIRGWQGTPIIIVDGFIRDAGNLTPSEIEQITVLKSAEAVILYGSMGVNGAIVVTTKRGTAEGLKVSVSGATGADVIRELPEFLGAAEYMSYRNQIVGDDYYSAEDIYYTALGNDKYRYPDENYYSSDYIKRAINRSDLNVELDGGNQRTHFYSNVGFYRTGDFTKIGMVDNPGSNRLNIRGNVDVKVTDNITAFVNANATFYDSRSNKGSIWNAAWNTRPNELQNTATLIPIDLIASDNQGAMDKVAACNNIIDGKYLLATTGTDAGKNLDIYKLYATGKNKNTIRKFQYDAGIKADLVNILKGLYFKTQFSMDFETSYNVSFDDEAYRYVPTWSNMNGETVIIDITEKGSESHSGNQNIGNSTNSRKMGGNVVLGYDKSFGDHNVSAMALGNIYQRTNGGEYHRLVNTNLGFNADYNFAKKYYLNLSVALPYTAKLAEGHRGGFSKSVSLGWNLANEDFLKGNSIVSSLSIYANAATIDEAEDIDSYYMYEGNWQNNYGGYSWGDSQKLIMGSTCTSGANYDLDFVKRKSISATLKAGFLNDMITLEGSYFADTKAGQLNKPSQSYPSFMTQYGSNFVGYWNMDDYQTKGFEFGATFKKKFGDVDFSLGAYGQYTETKWTKLDETHDYDYQYIEGLPVDYIMGYQSYGIFQSQEEIDNYVGEDGKKITYQIGGGDPQPGDLIYVDQNGDNKIDNNDRVYLGKWNPGFEFGLNLTAKYKAFTLFVAASAQAGGHGVKTGFYFMPDAEQGKYSCWVREAWTPELGESATMPRLSTNNTNNKQTSDFLMYKTDRFDIDRVQLTYDLPASWFENNFIGNASVFVNATNLITISKNKDILLLNLGSWAAQTRTVLFGVKVSF